MASLNQSHTTTRSDSSLRNFSNSAVANETLLSNSTKTPMNMTATSDPCEVHVDYRIRSMTEPIEPYKVKKFSRRDLFTQKSTKDQDYMCKLYLFQEFYFIFCKVIIVLLFQCYIYVLFIVFVCIKNRNWENSSCLFLPVWH